MLGSAPADEAVIRSVMSSYEAALNASNTGMRSCRSTPSSACSWRRTINRAVGKAAVRRAYHAVFKAIMFKV